MKFFATMGLLACLFLSHKSANAALVISMAGEVQEGTLNGIDLAGTVFAYEAFVTDFTDISSNRDIIGTFAVDEAVLDFGTAGRFAMGPNPGYFYWGASSDLFFAGIASEVDPQIPAYDHGLQFLDQSTDITNFQPTLLRAFNPFANFDVAETFGARGDRGSPFSATNTRGDTLTISRLGDPGFLAITAVPEPGSLAAILCFVPATLLRRSRPTRSPGNLWVNATSTLGARTKASTP